MAEAQAQVVSSFTIIKGSFIEESYAVFRDWDFSLSRRENLRKVREENSISARSASWAVDVAKVLNRRFDLACDREVWKPLLLWHMTRDELLVRDFLRIRVAPLEVTESIRSAAK